MTSWPPLHMCCTTTPVILAFGRNWRTRSVISVNWVAASAAEATFSATPETSNLWLTSGLRI